MYTVVSFLASHPIVLISIGATLAIFGALMPYVEGHIRPKEYIYLAWAASLKSDALVDYERFEWPHGSETLVLPVPQPKQLDVQRSDGKGGSTAKLMLMAPHHWGVEMWMGVEGMEPASRNRPKDTPEWNLRLAELGTSGERITREYLQSSKDDGVRYSIQGIEWWYTAEWNPNRRVQITRPLSNE